MATIKTTQQVGLAGVVGALATGIIISTLVQVEDIKNDPYRDVVGVWTVCGGETQVEMRHYTDAECLAMLDASAAEYARPVLKCVPQLKDKPYQLSASVIMAYNVGAGTYCNSTTAREFKAGNDRKACAAMALYSKGTFPKGAKPPRGTSGCVKLQDGRTRCVINGLKNRRKIEMDICEKGL